MKKLIMLSMLLVQSLAFAAGEAELTCKIKITNKADPTQSLEESSSVPAGTGNTRTSARLGSYECSGGAYAVTTSLDVFMLSAAINLSGEDALQVATGDRPLNNAAHLLLIHGNNIVDCDCSAGKKEE